VCELPAATAHARRAKAAALLTLVALDPAGRPEQIEDLPLWSALQDLAAAGDEAEALVGKAVPPEALRAALRIVWQAARHWELDDAQVRRLLGDPGEAAFQGWFRDEAPKVPPETRRRIGLIVALHRLLRQRYAWPDRGFDWMTRPHPQLGNRSPLARMLDGALDDLLAVHAALTSEAGAGGPEAQGRRLPPASAPLEAAVEVALARYCDRERGGEASPEAGGPPSALHFPSWEAVERWVWDGDGDEDVLIRSRIARLLVLARRVISDEGALRRWLTERQPWIGGMSPLAAAVTPGGLHRAERLLHDIKAYQQRLRNTGIFPDDPER
jgi:uncharacterized protein (DUF2384 family)